jgi:NAD(P)-dependent dehydrogenase (short-subunit alcohol dehydrogenase family)
MAGSCNVAIITGGGYGIGRAAALQAAAQGWTIVVVDVDPTKAAETQNKIAQSGGRAAAVAGDVTDARTAERAVTSAKELGIIKGLVNCAAMRHPGPITQITEAQWDETISVILKGVFLFCRAAIPEMIGNGGGSIVNVSSADASGRKNMVAYASAKGAVNTLTLCLAADHLQDRIRVNTVIPGFTLTGMTEHYSQARLNEMSSKFVAGRPGEPDDVANIIRFLLSDESETVTGGFFGGQTLAMR